MRLRSLLVTKYSDWSNAMTSYIHAIDFIHILYWPIQRNSSLRISGKGYTNENMSWIIKIRHFEKELGLAQNKTEALWMRVFGIYGIDMTGDGHCTIDETNMRSTPKRF